MPKFCFVIGCAAAIGVALGMSRGVHGQVVTIVTNTTINASDTTIGSPPVPLATAQIVVRGVTLTINRPTPISVASLELRASGGMGATLTHTPGTRIDITTSGNLSVDANSVITADLKGLAGSDGPGAGQSANGFNGGGAGYGGAGGDGLGSSQASTTSSGLGGNCYAFDQASLFGPTALGSGGGAAWVNGVRDGTSGGFGGGAIKLTVGGTLTLNGQISARGGAGSYRGSGSDRSGGGGSGGSIFIVASSVSGTGSIVASGGNGLVGGQNSGGGGGGRVAIITNSASLDEIATPIVTGGTGHVRGGAGTFYRRLGGESRGTLFIDGNNAAIGENTEFYGPLTLDANLVIQNNGRLGPRHRLTDSDADTFDLTVLGNVTVAGGVSPGAIRADGRGRRGDSGAGAGLSQEGFNGGGGGYGGQGGAGGGFAGSGGGTYGDPYSLLLGSGGGSAWVFGSPDRTSGGFGGGTVRLHVHGVLTVNGQISARGGPGDYRGAGSDRSGGGGSGGSIFVAAGGIAGSGSIVASGGGGIPSGQSSGGGGGGRVVVVSCSPSNPSVNVSGGTGSATGQAGTSIVRSPGFLQQPSARTLCAGGSTTFQVVAVTVGSPTYQWRRNGTPINVVANPSAATASLTLPSVNVADSGSYDCVVTSVCGALTSTAVSLTVRACPCSVADVTGIGGPPSAPDGLLTGDDFNTFISAFAAGGLQADIVGIGGLPPGDNLLTGDDFVAFIAAFASGCP
ncbi:MAG: GC-type dockerin domain-anchored protein [bacterium]